MKYSSKLLGVSYVVSFFHFQSILVGLLILAPLCAAAQDNPGQPKNFEAHVEETFASFADWFRVIGLDVDSDVDQNEIPDLAHAALLDRVLRDAGHRAYPVAIQAFEANLPVAQGHRSIIMGSGLGMLIPPELANRLATALTGLFTIHEPNAVHSLNAALLGIYPGLESGMLMPQLDLGAYSDAAQSFLSAQGDADGDGHANLDEYLMSESVDDFLTAALGGSAAKHLGATHLEVTVSPVYGDSTQTSIGGIAHNLPGNGEASLVGYVSRNNGKYYSHQDGPKFRAAIRSGVPWEFEFPSHHDPFAVRTVFYVIPETASAEAAPWGVAEVTLPAGVLASASLIRSPGLVPASAEFHRLTLTQVGSGAVYEEAGNIGYNAEGSRVRLWARASLGWRFSRWYGTPDFDNSWYEHTGFDMDSGHRVIAVFVPEDSPQSYPYDPESFVPVDALPLVLLLCLAAVVVLRKQGTQ